MTFLGLEARTDLPKVSYPSALDFFVFLSFAFIFATILQFAVVHYFTKYGSGECYFNFLEDSSSSSDDEDEDAAFLQQTSSSHLSSLTQIDSVDIYGVIPLSRVEIELDHETKTSGAFRGFRKFMSKYFFCLSYSQKSQNTEDAVSESVDESIGNCEPTFESATSTFTQNTPECRRHSNMQRQSRSFRRNFNSVSKIDKFSRVAFPLLFFAINVLYWTFYLSRSQRK